MTANKARLPFPDFDLIIIGASFAGLAAAKAAAMRGLRVAIVEAKREPGARIHTTGILVPEAAQEIDIPHWLTRRVPGVRLYAPNLKSVDLFSPGYAFLTTRTADLLRWLAREAVMAGAKLICGTKYRGAERVGELICVHGLGLTTRFLIGADGARSRVARTFGLDQNQKFLTGVEVELQSNQTLDKRYLHCFIDRNLAPGYIGWAAPGPDVTQVGLAVSGLARPDLDGFLSKTKSIFDWDYSTVSEHRAGLVPCGGVLRRFGEHNVLLIGDAAGWVSPMTAGGIRTAFRYGRMAGIMTADHLLSNGPAPQRSLAHDLPSFRMKGLMRRGLDLGIPNWVMNFALSTTAMQAIAQRIYFHRRGVSSIDYQSYKRWLQANDVSGCCEWPNSGKISN